MTPHPDADFGQLDVSGRPLGPSFYARRPLLLAKSETLTRRCLFHRSSRGDLATGRSAHRLPSPRLDFTNVKQHACQIRI